MNRVYPVFLSVLLVSLAACGSNSKNTDFFGAEEVASKPKVVNSTRVKRNWRVALGDKITPGGAQISPGLLGAHLYAASPNGLVTKVNAEDGKRVWRSRLKGVTISAGVGVGGGLVLIGTDQGILYALSQQDGSVAWQRQLSSEILASPVIDRDVVVARAADGKMFGLSAFDGDILWTISRQLPKLTLRGDSKPLLYGGVAFAGFADGTLAAVEAKNGRALWDFPISFPRGSSEIDRIADIDTNPLLVSNYIYVSSYQEVTHALNIQQQRIEWSVDVSSFSALAYDAAYLYISDKKGVVHQIDRTDGRKVWSQQGLRLFDVSAPIATGSHVMVADGNGSLYIMNKSNGNYVGKHKLGAKTIIGESIVEGDNVYFIDSNGGLQSISIVARNA